MPTRSEAIQSLADTGPGGICAECGHFAMRHWLGACHFPRPADNPCVCGGMLWQGHRVEIEDVVKAANAEPAP